MKLRWLDVEEMLRSGRLDEAEMALNRLRSTDPRNADAVHSLGLVAYRKGRQTEAIELLQRSVALRPSRTDLQFDLATVLGRVGQREAAVSAFAKIAALEPTWGETHQHLGLLLAQMGRLREAADALRRAVGLKPSLFDAQYNLGKVLRDLEQHDEAAIAFRSALALRPDDRRCIRDLLTACTKLGRAAEVVSLYRRLLSFPDATEVDHSNLLFTLHYDPSVTSDDLYTEAMRYHSRVTAMTPPGSTQLPNDRSPDRRLRVGYITSDFRDHPIARLLEPVLSDHDRSAVEVYCYCDTVAGKDDHVTAHLRGLTDVWRETGGMLDSAVVEMIRADRIDILVELNGHFGNNRLPMFIRRAAPVQVSHFGYCNTTGAPGMDYRISDTYSDPPGVTDRLHTERLVRLDGASWCYRPWPPPSDVGPLPAPLRGYVTFGNLNNAIKTSDPTAAAWAAILKRVPSSRLMLLAQAGTESYVGRRFAALGVDPARLVLVNGLPRQTYAAMYGQCDIGLDPFPFNGDNTTCDAMWMGVPVVSLAGETFCGRRGVSHLTNVGVPELVADTPNEYVEIAAALAMDLARLASLRSTLRDRLRQSPLGDVPAFVRKIESAYRHMWHEWCRSSAC